MRKEKMEIKQATMYDFEEIMSFYNVMCEVLGEKDFLPDGDKGGFPSQDMVTTLIIPSNGILTRQKMKW